MLGLAAARALERVRGRELTDVTAGLVVGAVDGLAFLGVVGTLFGAVYGYVGEPHRELLLNLALGVGLLAIGAAVLGTMATSLIRAGVWGIGVVFVAALAGAALGARLAGVPGLFYGATIGFGMGRWSASFAERPGLCPPKTSNTRSSAETTQPALAGGVARVRATATSGAAPTGRRSAR